MVSDEKSAVIKKFLPKNKVSFLPHSFYVFFFEFSFRKSDYGIFWGEFLLAYLFGVHSFS